MGVAVLKAVDRLCELLVLHAAVRQRDFVTHRRKLLFIPFRNSVDTDKAGIFIVINSRGHYVALPPHLELPLHELEDRSISTAGCCLYRDPPRRLLDDALDILAAVYGHRQRPWDRSR